MAQILLVEDDPALAAVVVRWLKREGHQVNLQTSGAGAIEFLKFADFDLLILDIELPDATGIEILKTYRNKGGKAQAIFLTSRSSIDDKIVGFEAGADDYLSKPFHAKELLMRVNVLLRRGHESTNIDTKIGEVGLQLIPARSSVRNLSTGAETSLTQREFALLDFLLRRSDQVVPAERLLNSLWQGQDGASPEALAACVTRLRKKLDTPGSKTVIKNVHGRGYQIQSID